MGASWLSGFEVCGCSALLSVCACCLPPTPRKVWQQHPDTHLPPCPPPAPLPHTMPSTAPWGPSTAPAILSLSLGFNIHGRSAFTEPMAFKTRLVREPQTTV